MNFTNRLQLIAFVTLTLSGAGALGQPEPAAVGSPEEAESVLAARSEVMKGMGSAMKAFTNFRKRGEGEPSELAAMAAEIAENALRIPELFPRDTGMMQFEDSEAKSEIWDNWEEFVAGSNALAELAIALGAAFDSGDKGEIFAGGRALGRKGCHTCHKKFRDKHE